MTCKDIRIFLFKQFLLCEYVWGIRQCPVTYWLRLRNRSHMI